MGLTSAVGIAQSALANSAAQSALISQNIANVSNPDYSRLSATTVSSFDGTVSQGPTQRATSAALLASLLSAQSASATQQALGNGLTSLASTLGLDNTSSTAATSATDTSPATTINALATALQQYAADPDNASLASAAVNAATTVTQTLNAAAANVSTVREQADSDMATSVATINSLLAQFQVANTAVVQGTAMGTDVSQAQDTRDGLLKQLSTQIGITTSTGSDGGISIYTDSGATLFNKTARTVAFTQTPSFTGSSAGQAVTVDGIPVTGASAVMPIKSGTLAGLATLRDDTSVAYSNQLDQIASSLVSAFSEADPSGNGGPTLAGVFTNGGSTTVPSSVTGLAASIAVNAMVDPSAGGVATNLRDGINYTYNTGDDAGYSDRLNALVSALGSTRSFDQTSGGAASGSIADYATSSVSWISAQQQTASTAATSTGATASAATTALSNATGVNLDDEMSRMLDVEHAYQASAQLMNTVNTMYTSLLQAFN